MPKNGIDTGTGGFSIDGNQQTYHVVDTNVSPEPSLPDTQWSSGDVNVDQNVKDISKKNKKTLASYLSKTTLGKTPSSPNGASNVYPIIHTEDTDPKNLSLQDSGYAVGPDLIDTQQPHFSNFVPGDSRSENDVVLNKTVLTRGNSKPLSNNAIDGNQLLKDAVINDDKKLNANSPVYQYYTKSIVSNRFNNLSDSKRFDAAIGEVDSYESNPWTKKTFMSRNESGKSNKSAQDYDISFGKLAQIGASLSVRASGEKGSINGNPTSGEAELNAVLPNLVQEGYKRISRDILTAEDVLTNPNLGEISENTLINPMADSWGVMNNVNDRFSGVSNFGMRLLAVAQITALIVSIEATAGSLSLLIPDTNRVSRPKEAIISDKNAYGLWRPNNIKGNVLGIDLWNLLGINPIRNEVSKCLSVGVLTFFGISVDTTENFNSDKAKSAANLALSSAEAIGKSVFSQSPGYYATITRDINRSFVTVSDAFKNIGKSNSLVSGAQSFLDFAAAIRDAKFIKVLNIFAQLGDQALYSSDMTLDEDNSGFTKKFISKTYQIDGNDSSVFNRLGSVPDGKSKRILAWSSHRATDLILPEGFQKSSLQGAPLREDGGGGQSNILLKDNKDQDKKRGIYVNKKYVTNDRIDDSLRIEIENSLESEYVPFYFHDIRTNEIVSFHAFLSSLTDDYTASYDSSEAFGRVEPIKTYKGTQRKIGFSFYAVSTNQDDFNYMWTKINKLTTLVYPQFTEGRKLIDEKNKNVIHAPFSQTIQASPLIRIRLGDLIKSNYSKFNLSKLFGYGSEATEFSGETINSNNPDDENERRKNKKDTFYRAGERFFANEFQGLFNEKGTIPKGIALVILDGGENNKFLCEIVLANSEDYEDPDELTSEIKEKAIAWKDNIDDVKVIIDKSSLRMTNSTEKKFNASIENTYGSYDVNAKNFMEEENNSITKSFKSVGGKGLAGFIESMNFDWYDRVTWAGIGENESSGRIAPKMCKITVSFSPIHDITPGLDHHGVNRAPIYPVGFMNVK